MNCLQIIDLLLMTYLEAEECSVDTRQVDRNVGCRNSKEIETQEMSSRLFAMTAKYVIHDR